MNRLLQALGLMRVSEHERLLHHEILQPPISDRNVIAQARGSFPDMVQDAQEKGNLVKAGVFQLASACNKCGARYPTAPAGHLHKCGLCSGVCSPVPDPEPVDWEAKFKKAITDLAAARDQVDIRGRIIDGLEETISDLRPDALAMRRKRERDRNRRKGKV